VADANGGRIGVGIFRAITRVLQERGCDPGGVFERAGIGIDAVLASEEPLRLEDAYRLLEIAAEEANDPNFGLRLAPEIPVGAAGLLGHLQATAPTVRHMVEKTAQYGGLMIQPIHCTFEPTPGGATFSAVMPGSASPEMRQLTDLLMALFIDRIRIGAGPLWYPPMVTFATSAPGDISMYEDHFGPEIWFSQPTFSIAIEDAVLDRALPNRVLGLFDQIEPLAQRELAAIEEAIGVARVVRVEIAAAIDSEQPVTLETIAARLDLTPRGLQWRLHREDKQTFEGLVSRVRADRARVLLADPDLSMTEVAARLGFTTPSAFSRWSNAALGKSPSAVRRDLLGRGNRSSS
jgi:AraC-like DNA-binding protein